MADLTQCDGCGRISPENGKHIANHWFTVEIEDHSKGLRYSEKSKQKYILCRECFLTDSEKFEPKWLGILRKVVDFKYWYGAVDDADKFAAK